MFAVRNPNISFIIQLQDDPTTGKRDLVIDQDFAIAQKTTFTRKLCDIQFHIHNHTIYILRVEFDSQTVAVRYGFYAI